MRTSSSLKVHGILCICCLFNVAATAAFPPEGIDSFPTASPFSVTINGVTYRADVFDPGTIVARSAPTTEGAEGAEVVGTIGCPACSPTVSDADLACFPAGLGGPATRREIHTEMLSLGMCGTTADGRVVCYLAGQPAANAPAGRLPGQANYRNTFGEMVSKDPTGNPALDLPAASFWALRGVVTINPAPPGTSGVFFSKDPVLMLLDPVATLPPPVEAVYHNISGVTNEAGGGAVCGSLPAALYDAGPVGGPAPPDIPVGQINCGTVHQVREVSDAIKWERPPDLTNGLDVRATSPKILADDFLCTQTGYITDIHIWASWLSNNFDPGTRFCLGLWSDVATNMTTNVFSHPGILLWSNWFNPCEYQVYLYATNAQEQFYDPNINQIIGPDSDVYYYSFYPTNPCWQVAGTIYWLSVTAQTSSTNFIFGWKTAITNFHFQDDAVYGHVDTNGNPLQDWKDMHYPPGHPYGTNRSIDLAFRITTPVLIPPITNPPIWVPNNCLPPAGKRYGGVMLKNAHQNYGPNLFNHIGHDEFADWATPPPPKRGAFKVHDFGSTVRGLFSMDNGGSYTEIALPASVRVRTTHDHMQGDIQVLRAEIESLDITNTSPPIRIRESPVLLSSGMTALKPVAGGFAVSSFFNVWTEVSTNGGASWIPSSVPGHMELREAIGPQISTTTNLSPPPGVSFCEPPPDIRCPPTFGPIVVRNFWHNDLPSTNYLPTVGGTNLYTATGTTVQADVSTDGGFSFQHVSAPATVTVSMRATANAGTTRYFIIEILGLDISGGGLPSGLRFRESPSYSSWGEHIIRNVPGGVSVSSYFDVFLEMSLDNGLTWIPGSGAIHLDIGGRIITVTNETSFAVALTNLQDGDTIRFNVAGPGPHYLQTPPGGYPYITRNNVTIDGYSQPGALPNSNPILASNNAQIKIVLDSRNGNYRSMAYEPTNSLAGFGTNEFAILGIFGGTNVHIRGLCLLGAPGNGTPNLYYGIAIARNFAATAAAAHVSGCWIGVDLNQTSVFGLDGGVVAFRHRDGSGVNTNRLPSNGHIIGVAPNSINPRAEFNVIADASWDVLLEGQRHRVSGNFLGVLPDGLHDYLIPLAEPGRFVESHVEIGRGASDVVIGTDGDGLNDADERNIFGGVLPPEQGGYDYVVEFYSLAGSPGPDTTRVKIAGNYFGVGVDGSTRFTNRVPALSGLSSTSNALFWVGSDFDGVSDALEANVVFNNYPPPYTNSTANAHGFIWNPATNGLYALRGDALVNNYPFPANPGHSNGPNNFLLSYVNKALQTPATNLAALYPVLSNASSIGRLIGTVPVGNTNFPSTMLDLYLPDPQGLTNGLVFPDPNLTNGWVQGVRYLGTFVDNGPEDLDGAPGRFQFDIFSLGLTNGTKVTVTANYSMDPPGTHNGRTLTSLFSPPLALRGAIFITSITRSGSTLTIKWTGSSTLYQLQRATALGPVWNNVGAPTSLTTATVSLAGGMAFYRVLGN